MGTSMDTRELTGQIRGYIFLFSPVNWTIRIHELFIKLSLSGLANKIDGTFRPTGKNLISISFLGSVTSLSV